MSHRYPAQAAHSAENQDTVELDTFVQALATMSFGIYIGGIVLVLGGLVYGAAILHVPLPWIVVGALVALGLGVLAAVNATRMRDRAG